MFAQNQTTQTLTRPDRTERFPGWIALLWLLGFVALLGVMMVFVLTPGPAIYAESVMTRLFWPIVLVSGGYGILTAMAAHRLGTWRYSMYGKMTGPAMSWLILASASGMAMWLVLQIAPPNILAFTARQPFTQQAELTALRGGSQKMDSPDRVILGFLGHDKHPYVAHLAGDFGRFDNVGVDTAMGLTALPHGSTSKVPVPVTITGMRNWAILVVDDVTR